MNDIVKYSTDHGEVELSKDTVRKYLVNGGGNVTDQEITMFLALCKYQQLNPFLREAYLIKYGSSPATVIVGKDTFTKRAAKAEKYDGCEAGVIVVDDEREVTNREGTLVIDGEQLVGGWAKGYRKDWDKAVFISVNFNEYEGKKSTGETNKVWKKQPATMIRKVALVQMLRELFPDVFQGLYDSAEMGVEADLPEKTVKMPQEKERDVTPKSEGKEDDRKGKSTTKPVPGKGSSPPKKEKPAPKREKEIIKAEELDKTEVDKLIDEKMAEKIAGLEKKCRAGITIMEAGNLIDEPKKVAFEKELQEYIDGGALEFLQNLYAELHTMYFDRVKKGK